MSRPLPRGVQRKFESNTYSARIYDKGQHWYLGSFRSIEEAAHAYNKAAVVIHGESARLNPVGGIFTDHPEDDRGVILDMRLIEENSIPVPEAGCWLWTGTCSNKGYGAIPLGKRGMKAKAHRVSWSAKNGPIPDGLVVCHKCDTPQCVNPDHLFVGTVFDNNRDRRDKGGYIGNSGLAVVSERDVVEIRDLEQAMTHSEIAGHYGISQRNVSHICRRRSWKHVQ